MIPLGPYLDLSPKAQLRYKKKFDPLLRQRRKELTPDEIYFLRVVKNSEKEIRRHKLAPIEARRFQIVNVYDQKIVIEIPIRIREEVGLDCAETKPPSPG